MLTRRHEDTYLQHVPFEDLVNVTVWAKEKGHSVSGTSLFKGEEFPDVREFDWLIALGGLMNVYEEGRYPWLIREKLFIKRAIKRGKIVLGICLGAQLIADVLGGLVYKNDYKEIGWFPVELTQEALKSRIFSTIPKKVHHISLA